MKRKTTGPKSAAAPKSRREPGRRSAPGTRGEKSPERARKGSPKRRAAASEAAPALEPTPVAQKRIQEARAAALAAIDAALDKKALLPVLMDVSDRASYTDFIGIVSGRSDRQVDAIAENVVGVMKERGYYLSGREGNGNGRWTLLDFGNVVLHVFYHPVREFYDIESLWIDAPRVKLQVPPEAMQLEEGALFYDRS